MRQMIPCKDRTTGRHYFDVPYCYEGKIKVCGLIFERGNGAMFAPRDLTDFERTLLVAEIEKLNAEWERANGVNQPVAPYR